MVETLKPLGGQVAGIMHTRIEDTAPALGVLREHWSGPTMAYAETGHWHPGARRFDEACPPADYAREVESWIRDHGVQIVGGCCGTGPEHIRALRTLIDGL